MTKLEPTRTSSDLTATERLRELLDERGMEYTANERDTQWWPKDNPAGVLAENSRYPRDTLDVYGLTPAQAIAATLGREMLTADDVRDLIERHSDASGGNGRDFHNGAYVAIADELNATLGSCNCTNNCTNSERTNETCHADETDTWECVCDQVGRYGKRVTIHVMECSECGRTYEHVNGSYEYCPRCRRKVIEPTTNDVDAEVDA